MNTQPSLPRLYARALRPGTSARPRTLSDLELELDEVTVDRGHVAAYDRVCGFGLRDALPPTYPHVLTFPLQLQLMTHDSFPFRLAGMVHIRNVITQQRPLDAGNRLRLHVRADRLTAHPKGAQVDLVATAYADDDSVGWHSRSTYLARGANVPDDRSAAARIDRPDHAAPDLPEHGGSTWRVGKDIGRRYAGVSGDVNPIHLHPLGARLFGFPGTIAHGMWTKARSLAALGSRLPESLTADVTFQAPLQVPSTVRFLARPTSDGWDFGVLPSPGGRPHLTGHVGPATQP